MSFLPIGAVIVLLLFGSAMLGMLIARFLPPHHLDAETKNVVSVSMAVVGTLSALVLGLLISGANASFTAKTQEVARISAELIRLDRLLRHYGPEAGDARVLLRRYAEAKLEDLFPRSGRPGDVENDATIGLLEDLEGRILTLAQGDDGHRWLRAQALQATDSLAASRWRLVQESASTTPFALVVLVLFWFVIIFISFGLFAPRNATAIVAILLCSVGVGGAIRMTAELQKPFQGLIRISSAPLSHALQSIGR